MVSFYLLLVVLIQYDLLLQVLARNNMKRKIFLFHFLMVRTNDNQFLSDRTHNILL